MSITEQTTLRRVTTEELLQLREVRWRQQARSVSLAAELDVKDAHAAQVAQALGAYHRRTRGTRSGDAMFTRWPACVVLAMTGVAASRYVKGTFWPAFAEAIGCTNDPDMQKYWGVGFQTALRQLGLEPFDDVALRHVGPVLMHTGVPTYCFADLLRLLVSRVRLDPELDAESFLTWATAQQARMQTLDKPVRRFLTRGTDFALDFIDRCLELIDCLGNRDADVSQVALPSRLTDRAAELARDGQLTVGHGGGDRGRRTRVERPRIGLDPWGRGVEVILPSVGDAIEGSAVWEVVADGVAATVRSRSVWSGVAEAAPETSFTIGRPTRTVVVSLLGAPHQSEFQLINADAPWLTFSSTGRLIPSHAALPPDPIWVLYPDNQKIATDKPLRVIEEGRVPSGWSGWRLELISLVDATWLQLTDNPTSRRAVRGFTRPRIETGPPVDGIDTPYGSRVFAALPQVWLPSRPGTETEWRITVRTASARDVIQHRVLRSTGEVTVTDLWETLPRPILGAFSITVAGPLGYGVDRTVFVAEGLQSSFQPPVRLLTRHGLSPASATIIGPVGATAEPSRLSLTPQETAKVIEYRTAAETEPLLVRPPHLRVSYEVIDDVPHWRPRPLSLIADELREAPGVVAVQLPPGTVSPRAQLVVDEACVQELIVTRSGDDSVCRLHVGQLSDTLAAHPLAHLVLICGDLAMPVATIRPRRLADQVSLDGDALVLLNPAPVPRLNAAVYLTRAPWRAPLVLPAQGDRVPLPTSLTDAGPLLVSLSVPDSEWVVTEQPRWPKRYQTIGGDGYLRDGSPDEAALSRYLAGE
ncbi:MAG: hypothetical protein QOH97_5199, partial [Actinoplanes sp.]|nr:hypothetical protein [Actinoplanes sp.]